MDTDVASDLVPFRSSPERSNENTALCLSYTVDVADLYSEFEF